MTCSCISGMGKYLPDYILTNDGLSEIVDTSDDWIRERTGIRERRVSHRETTWQMALKAAQDCIADWQGNPADIDFVMVTTLTPDYYTPNTASALAAELGCDHAFGFDLSAACTGFVYALDVADSYIKAGKAKHVLVVSVENMTRILDFTDRTTCVLFGDGAGAAILSVCGDGAKRGVISSYLALDGGRRSVLTVPATVCHEKMPWEETVADTNGQHAVMMDGREVFRFSIGAITEAVDKALERAGLTIDDIAWFIPHQANIRIIQHFAHRYHLDMEKIFTNIDKYGNTSSASIPICLKEMKEQGKIQKGQLGLIVGFGGGLSYGAAIIEF